MEVSFGSEKLTSVSHGARFLPERSSGSQADSHATFHSSSPVFPDRRRRAVGEEAGFSRGFLSAEKQILGIVFIALAAAAFDFCDPACSI